jgi:hypothetical protein
VFVSVSPAVSQDGMVCLPGVDAVDGVPYILASKHNDAEGKKQGHSSWAVEVEHRRVNLDAAHLQQRDAKFVTHGVSADEVCGRAASEWKVLGSFCLVYIARVEEIPICVAERLSFTVQ